jgi:acyl CoA:acetate/3-ketoacid CoA transferase
LEESIQADVAIIKAKKADKKGNLWYSKTARNFNPDMAKNAKYVVAEVEEIIDGYLEPENVHTPGIFVDAVVLTETNHKPIERLTNIDNTINADIHKDPNWAHRIRIAKRASKEIP